jgi:hypothetical protein
MDSISKTEALSVLSKWERQNQPLCVLCLSSSFSLTSKSGRVVMCLDESFELSLVDETKLRIFIAEALFSRVGADDFPAGAKSLDLVPEFDQGIHISLLSRQVQWYFLASLPPAADSAPIR